MVLMEFHANEIFCAMHISELCRRVVVICAKIAPTRHLAVVSGIISVYCLFSPDIQRITTATGSAGIFDIITFISISIFAIEMAVSCIGVRGYTFSLLFLIDIVGTGAAILGIGTVADGILNISATPAKTMGIIRILRLLVVPKLFRRTGLSPTITPAATHRRAKPESPNKGEVDGRLSRSHHLRAVLIVVSVSMGLSFLETSTGLSTDIGLHREGLAAVHRAYVHSVWMCMGGSPSALDYRTRYEDEMRWFINQTRDPPSKGLILYIGTYAPDTNPCFVGDNSPGVTIAETRLLSESETVTFPTMIPAYPSVIPMVWHNPCERFGVYSGELPMTPWSDCPASIRPDEASLVTTRVVGGDDVFFEVVVDERPRAREAALMSIYQKVVVCAIILLGCFSRGAFRRVLEPVQRVMARIEQIRSNPIMATHIDDLTMEQASMEKIALVNKVSSAPNVLARFLAARQLYRFNRDSNMDMLLLEKAIVRIGGLLAVGFGQAGAAIVAQNMTSSGRGINAMVPGKRIDAIFASIRILNFVTVTSVLQDKVMLFVNQVCEIVHGIADEFHGMANRNNGDSMLIVWRIPTGDVERTRKVHDMALAACVKICIAVKRSVELAEYRYLPPLMQKLDDFRVELNFGLHKGWGIEGAIGSNLKIDASYLGPDVNIAEVIEGANSKFGTTILASETVVAACSPSMKATLRMVNRVQLQSARNALYLYALDLDRGVDLIDRTEADSFHSSDRAPVSSRHRQRVDRERRKELRWNTDITLMLRQDTDFLRLRQLYEASPLFGEKFKNGYLNYECGEWGIARLALGETVRMLERVTQNPESLNPFTTRNRVLDGPSKFILEYMRDSTFIAPSGWVGIRKVVD